MGCIENGRYANDVAALILHVVATLAIVLIFSIQGSAYKPIALSFFLGQECIAVIAHLYYLFCYCKSENRANRGWWNSVKWTEYGFSATAGTLGTFFAGTEPGTPGIQDVVVVIVLLGLGFSQQRIGYVLDFPLGSTEAQTRGRTKSILLFSVAVIFQIIEVVLVILQEPPSFITPIYVVMWSLFGIHCFCRLWAFYKNGAGVFKPWTNDYWTEMVYSYLGWTAKISVLLVAVPDAFTDLNTAETNGMYGLMSFLFLFTFSGLVFLYQSYFSNLSATSANGESLLSKGSFQPSAAIFE
ncbi:MAG: hypothetical protein CL678_17610 [Bdellovibrionaceae bacterium]|nr:hypothetical protein [Pseudobdellovibrionaceae bacterium]|tara:strand:+ start:71 stop:964 length:894 start_codon:yes stop_codon:yes gene_type:complete